MRYQPPPLPRSAVTGTPATLKASMSRWMVRSETSRRLANSRAVVRRLTWSNSRMETRRSARIPGAYQENMTERVRFEFWLKVESTKDSRCALLGVGRNSVIHSHLVRFLRTTHEI